MRAECRKVEAGTFPARFPDEAPFSNNFWHDGEYLRVPCDRSGIVCVDSDQAWAHEQASKHADSVEESESNTDPLLSNSSRQPFADSSTPEGTLFPGINNGGGGMSTDKTQAPRDSCSDYEIRFLCESTGK
ncbi:hypothetical protein PoB_007259200 [Plakobranchus ocellatus]|uniref:Uncharacterized protein n=2 Tax=Plakobranchus ocellatus TaxID=259542 RepID=A0AAV4DPP2_9GAST|nr:hypothetical protein PoB_007259200 [Plakobranchus ocellatus]